MCDRLGLDPREVQYIQGDTDQVFFGEGTGGSRTATIGSSAFHVATDKIVTKARAIAAHMLAVDADDVKFSDGIFSAPGTNRTLTIRDIAKEAANPARLPKGMEGGLTATAVYNAEVENFPGGCHICELEIDPETGAVEILRYSVVDDVGTVLNPPCCTARSSAASRKAWTDPHGGHPLRHDRPADQRLVHGLRDAACGNFSPFHIRSNPVPTTTNPLGVKGAGEAGCVGALPAVANALVDALSELRHPSRRDAGDARAPVARDPGGEWQYVSPVIVRRSALPQAVSLTLGASSCAEPQRRPGRSSRGSAP